MRLFLALCLIALPAMADEVDLELVLLADASGSIDSNETRFQRQGYADAITDPRVISAIDQTLLGKVAVTYVEWADKDHQDVVVPWTIIDGPETAKAFAEALVAPPRRAYGRNAIGAALLKGLELIESNDHEGLRKVIDFSGDSANNWNGPSIASARETVLAAGITVNGLPIACRACSQPRAEDLESIYAERIIGGPGAFVLTADDGESLADAVRRKLILEISGTLPGPRHASHWTTGAESAD